MIKKTSELYDAIAEAIYDIFDGKIEIEDPQETTEQFVKKVNDYLESGR